MSVRHHEELSSQLKESEWLKQSLLECSNALHESISLLRAQEAAIMQYKQTLNIRESMNDKIASSGVNHSSNVLLSSLFKAVPSSLTETAAKFNIENISAACKSSVGPPSSGEQLSFLSKVKAPATEAPNANSTCNVVEPVEDISETKGGTMTLIESLMNSALNADRVLTKIVSGAQPMMQPNGYEFGEIGQHKGEQSASSTDIDSGSDKEPEADKSGSTANMYAPTVAIPATESLYFKLPAEIQPEPVANKALPLTTSGPGTGDYAPPPFFKFLQKNDNGSFGLSVDEKTSMTSPLDILSAVSASTSSTTPYEVMQSYSTNPEKRRRID